MRADHRLHFDDAGGDLDEAKAQRVELSDAPHRAFWHRDAKAPHQPVGAGVEKKAQLIGRRQRKGGLRAGRTIRRQMGFEGFDVVLGLAASAVGVLVKRAGVALGQVLAGRSMAVMKRPSPSNTTMG